MLPKIPKAGRIAARVKNRALSLIPSSRQARLLKSVKNLHNPLPERIPYRLSAEEQTHVVSEAAKKRNNFYKARLSSLEHFLRTPAARLAKQIRSSQAKASIISFFSFADEYGIENARSAFAALEKSDIKALREALLKEHSRLLASSIAVELNFAGLMNQRNR